MLPLFKTVTLTQTIKLCVLLRSAIALCGFISEIIEICADVLYWSHISLPLISEAVFIVFMEFIVNFSVDISFMYTQIEVKWVYVGVFESMYVNVRVLVLILKLCRILHLTMHTG